MSPGTTGIESLASLAIGQKVLSYEVVREIGRGGMGAVFEAHHQQLGPAAQVAVKLLDPDLASDPEISARFFNEARAASLVRHPGVVRIVDFGHLPMAEGLLAFIVMEYLDGPSLWRRFCELGRRHPSWPAVARQIAAAMAAVHAEGIVHRDLKPSNIVLVADPEVACGWRVKVVDFGIAKLRAEHYHADNTVLQTSAGVLMGTPLYMSPEQCARVESVDGKADVYSLGSILYQLLSGAPLFPEREPEAIVFRQMCADPTPIERLAPELPRDLVALVRSMLDKLPSRRPAMDEVARRLGAWDDGATTAVRGDGPPSWPSAAATVVPAGPGAGGTPWRRLLGLLGRTFSRRRR